MMQSVKEQKIIKLGGKRKKREPMPTAKKLIILAVAVILALLISQWDEVVSLLPKFDNNVYKTAQTGMGEHRIHSFGNKNMAYIGKNGLVVMDSKGKEKFSVPMVLESPSVAVSDKMIIFAPKGKNTIFKMDSSGKLTSFNTTDEITNIRLSAGGKIVALTNKKSYNGSAMVYSSRGEPLFEWNAGRCNLLDAALSPDGKKLALSVMYTGGTQLECSVMLFEIEKSATAYAEKSTGDNFVSSINWLDNNNLMIIGDKKMYSLNGKGADRWEFDYGGRQLAAFCDDEKNNIVVALGHSSLDKEYAVYSFNANGRKQCEYTFGQDITNISANSGRILITSKNGAQLISKGGRLREEIISDKQIYGGYIFKKGHKVLLDKGGYTEIFEMK